MPFLWCGGLFVTGAFMLVLGLVMSVKVQRGVGGLMVFLGVFMLIAGVTGPVFGLCAPSG